MSLEANKQIVRDFFENINKKKQQKHLRYSVKIYTGGLLELQKFQEIKTNGLLVLDLK